MTAASAVQQPGRAGDRALPLVIQGGMGVAVSSWRLASTIARAGQLGVVAGTALDLVLARRLQDGDSDGAVRRALAAFPVPEVAERIVTRYFRPGGRPPGTPYAPLPRLALRQTKLAQELGILGNFVEVWLAKEGHDGLVGINFLEKVQMATPTAAYGAMLAGVDYVLMGAGIPRDIPHLLDELAAHRRVQLLVEVTGATPGAHTADLDPRALLGVDLPPLTRPKFLAIVSAHALAAYLARDEHIRPDGFVVEGPRAGGHNAPPRGQLVLDERGEPVFGPRDDADVAKIAAVGLPFWLGGAFGTPEAVAAARAAGAAGVQVGTLFALSTDSGLVENLRRNLVDRLRAGTLDVRTDPFASPTGFPFKVAQLPGTLSDPEISADRPRLCDLGYLRTPYLRDTGAIGYRCKAEPVHVYVRKGGVDEDTDGRACLCNSLTANVGLGQTRADGYTEDPLVTLGADLDGARRLAAEHPGDWSAREALDWLLGAAA
ncbi:MAG TPA: nitronate monooxygenase [Cellulomonas sp.]|uniref:nitronate monooxygenase n=1 Tax=Cellulomonas sp. TaxID=40001 RepID=UPI002E3296DA|nr:nitronate monooxygenase [Cellulomonas sp.]HEX5331379.1 nitronate monooxygenase [Cellulomonas sp.]